MNNRTILTISLALSSVLIFSCGLVDRALNSGDEIELGAVLLEEDFSSEDAWEFFSDEGMHLEVRGGAYTMRTDSIDFIWGLNEQIHSDVVMEVTSTQNSNEEDNGYGPMCRANPSNNGDGYYFLISGDGYYSIRRGEGDDVTAIVDWTESSSIRQGQSTNTIRVACIGDYLALYVNDDLLVEVNDSTYSTGYAGFAVAVAQDVAEIAFDDLTIWEATRTQ